MAVFRSLSVPLVSAAFNLLSIARRLRRGRRSCSRPRRARRCSASSELPIVSFVPLFMFAILFGLSMDYNVFLLSRVREEYRAAPARARPRSPRPRRARERIITAAGAIMTAVFLGFVTDPDPVVKMIGLGLATAMLVDVTRRADAHGARPC